MKLIWAVKRIKELEKKLNELTKEHSQLSEKMLLMENLGKRKDTRFNEIRQKLYIETKNKTNALDRYDELKEDAVDFREILETTLNSFSFD